MDHLDLLKLDTLMHTQAYGVTVRELQQLSEVALAKVQLVTGCSSLAKDKVATFLPVSTENTRGAGSLCTTGRAADGAAAPVLFNERRTIVPFAGSIPSAMLAI
jgi:hypothetical protein